MGGRMNWSAASARSRVARQGAEEGGRSCAGDRFARGRRMNAYPGKKPMVPLVDLLRLMAESAAGSCELFGLEPPDVVDPLNEFSQQTGLVAAIGQDAVQAIIEAPFAWLAGALDYEAAAAADYAPQPVPKPAPRPYRTPQTVVDAFFYVVRNHDADYLARWLIEHPLDASHLKKLWEAKCSTAAA
jgi:hypothetical protein